MSDDRYPLTMNHPSYQPAVLSNAVANGHQGQPQRYPPVLVTTEDQEDYHLSLGYVPQKGPRQGLAMVAPAFDPAEWPRWEPGPDGEPMLFKTPVHYRDVIGVEFGEKRPPIAAAKPDNVRPAALDPDELAEFLAWKAQKSQVIGAIVEERRFAELKMSRAAMIQTLRKAGHKVDYRWSDRRLQDMTDEYLGSGKGDDAAAAQ